MISDYIASNVSLSCVRALVTYTTPQILMTRGYYDLIVLGSP